MWICSFSHGGQFVAKQMGIPVLELQHGLIGTQSIGYQFGISCDSALLGSPFPDVIIVFGDHFRRLLTINPYIKENMIVSAGYPYLWLSLQNPESLGDIA